MAESDNPYEALGKVPTINITLAVDGLHFDAARSALAHVSNTSDQLDNAVWNFASRERRYEEAEDSGEETDSPDLKSELAGAARQIEVAYGPCLQAITRVHILAAAALEAHINITGLGLLPDGLRGAFKEEKIREKWSGLPGKLNRSGFDENAEPFTGFCRLVGYRNALMHYKPKAEPWCLPDAPQFLQKLGLVQGAAETSVHVAESMIRELARLLDMEIPDWLKNVDASYFEIEGYRSPDW